TARFTPTRTDGAPGDRPRRCPMIRSTGAAGGIAAAQAVGGAAGGSCRPPPRCGPASRCARGPSCTPTATAPSMRATCAISRTALARRIGLRPGRRVASLAPGVHGHGLMIALGALAVGAPLVDLTHLPGPERVALLHHTSPHLLTGVPVHLADLLQADIELAGGRTLQIPRVVSGSDPLAPELRADLARHYRARVHDVHGTTET